VLHDFRRKHVKHLVGYASSLYLLSEGMRLRNVEPPSIRSVMATGDSLLPSYRRSIEATFGVGVVDYYGAGGEGFHLASQCEQRGDYHMHVENAVVEVLRDGRPARPGEMGEVVVTQLDNRAMPLVRYATQDMAVAAEPHRCSCGRELPMLKSIQGRVPDIVFAPDGSALVVHFFTILFEYLEDIRQFQVRQQVEDRIRVLIVPEAKYRAAATEARVRDAVAQATRHSLAVEFEYVDDIPIGRSGKRRFVISEIVKGPYSVVPPSGEEAISATARRA
jgi:phenylacetate-CoA ligase